MSLHEIKIFYLYIYLFIISVYLNALRTEDPDGWLSRAGHNAAPLLLPQDAEALQIVLRVLLGHLVLVGTAHVHGLRHGIGAGADGVGGGRERRQGGGGGGQRVVLVREEEHLGPGTCVQQREQKKDMVWIRVADPGCLSRILIFIPP
jgi:hypothetical protein